MEFFPGRRRKIELDDWVPLRNEQDEKRIRFDLLMPLTGQSYVQMPGFITPSYEQMEIEGSAIKDSDLLTIIDEVTLEFYATDASGPLEVEWGVGLDEAEAQAREQKRKLLLTHCTLRNFKLIRIKRGEDSIVALKFSLTTRSTAGLAAWAHNYNGKTMWGEFSIDPSPGQSKIDDTQAKIPLAGAELTPEKTPDPAAPPAKKEFCPRPMCVLEAYHEGDHEDALGTKITDGKVGVLQ